MMMPNFKDPSADAFNIKFIQFNGKTTKVKEDNESEEKNDDESDDDNNKGIY